MEAALEQLNKEKEQISAELEVFAACSISTPLAHVDATMFRDGRQCRSRTRSYSSISNRSQIRKQPKAPYDKTKGSCRFVSKSGLHRAMKRVEKESRGRITVEFRVSPLLLLLHPFPSGSRS